MTKAFLESVKSTQWGKRQSTSDGPELIVVLHTRCDACACMAFDRRYKCCACKDFDLCGACWDKGVRSAHNTTHTFILITEREHYFKGKVGKAVSHDGVSCDGCLRDPILGIRYKCNQCNTDFCEPCFLNGWDDMILAKTKAAHDPTHSYLRIVKPTVEIVGRGPRIGAEKAPSKHRTPSAPQPANLSTGATIGPDPEHVGISCDGCTIASISGVRWKCKSCPRGYDLCEDCYAHWSSGLPSSMHPRSHIMAAVDVSELD